MLRSQRGSWRFLLRGSLWVWLALPLLGCGANLQAEDTAGAAELKRARELLDGKQYAAARDKAATVLTKSPNHTQALYLRGLAQLGLKQYAAARQDLEQAKRIDPLLVFATDRTEFDDAWRAVQANAGATSGGRAVGTPPMGKGQVGAGSTGPRPAARRPEPTDPTAKALSVAGFVARDESGADLLGEKQRTALQQASLPLTVKGLTIKVLVIKDGKDAEAEARRLFEAAGLDETCLLLVGQAPGTVAAYATNLPPDTTRAEIAKALAPAAEATLGRRLILAMLAVGNRLQVAPRVPEAPAAGSSSPRPAGTTAPVPATGSPVALPPGVPSPARWYAVVAAAGAVAGVLLWLVLAKAMARRRLGTGFRMAEPQLVATAERLSAVLSALLKQTERQAAAAHAAAELAFNEAVAMMAAAQSDNTGDIARVERAGRLLSEAAEKLTQAEAALASAPERPAGPTYHCYFTGRPLLDRYDGDLVALQWEDAERLVLVTRAIGDRIRRGEQPLVRAVDVSGTLLHWATAPLFDPLRDLYHSDRCGHTEVHADQLREVFFDDSRYGLFVNLNERPDYTLRLG